MAYFITFEGVEGAGKSTQIKLLSNFLRKKNLDFISLREPGGTLLGEKIRKILLKDKNLKIDYITETLLMMVSRRELLIQKIFPSLKENKIVICDRFIHSTIAYQGYGRGVDIDWIRNIFSLVCFNFYPNLTFLLDIDTEEGFKRIKGKIKDRFEEEEISFHKRIREGFLKIAQEERERFCVLDGKGEKKEIFEKILKCLKEKSLIS